MFLTNLRFLGLGSATQGPASTTEHQKAIGDRNAQQKGCHIHAVLVEAPVGDAQPRRNWESTGMSEKIIADTVLSQEALSGLTPGELTTTTARGKAAAGQLREAKPNGETGRPQNGETKTDNHGRPEREISPSQGPDEAKPPSRAGKAGLPGPHWVDPILGSQSPNLSEFPKKDGSVGTANPSFGAGNGDLHRPNGKDHTASVLEPQEKGTAEGVEKGDLIIAPANGDQSGQIQATEGTPKLWVVAPPARRRWSRGGIPKIWVQEIWDHIAPKAA